MCVRVCVFSLKDVEARTAMDKLQMWNAINKINAFLCEYAVFSCFMVTGLKMEAVMSG